MVRKLPDDPVKRRVQMFKRIYQHLDHFASLRESGRMDMSGVITLDTGEDICLNDLMVGLEFLPPRQQQAFRLICLLGYTETAARDELLPNSKSSTPVQQYADSGLIRMVHAYDCKQAGIWPPSDMPKPKKTKRRSFIMAALHPMLRRHLEDTRKDIVTQMEEMQTALTQLDELLKEPQQPAPNPQPVGKPDLNEMARELAKTG